MNPVLAWILLIVLGLAILIMGIYGIWWLVVQIQLSAISKMTKEVLNICCHIYMYMTSKQREFVDGKVKQCITITGESEYLKNMSDELRNEKLYDLYDELNVHFCAYRYKISKSSIYIREIVYEEFDGLADIVDAFGQAELIN